MVVKTIIKHIDYNYNQLLVLFFLFNWIFFKNMLIIFIATGDWELISEVHINSA